MNTTKETIDKRPDTTILDGMAWTKPAFTRSQVDQAGKILISPSSTDEQTTWATGAMNNWRFAHGYPLKQIRTDLTMRAKRMDATVLIAHRIKRPESIQLKLRNIPTMKLSQMQDIGGCRAIVSDVGHVSKISETYEQLSDRSSITMLSIY
jgi:hypothetical protein